MQIKQQLWIITELFPPDETATSYILGEIANAMVLKYNVRVICGSEVYDRGRKIDKNNKFKLHDSIEIYRIKEVDLDKNTIRGKILSFTLVSLRLMSLAKKYIQKGDKVLMVTNPATIIPLIARLREKRGFELNILVHDVFPENVYSTGLRLPMYNIIKCIFDRAYAKADQLIVLGRDMAKVLNRKVHINSNSFCHKITIIENWADVENIKPQPFPEGKIILEYAGNIGRVQGLDKVLDMVQRMENIELHIYGTCAMEEKLKAREQKNVFFHGSYFRSQQNEVLAACDIAIVSLQEGMYGLGVPSKTYNILASGRPILFIGPRDSEIDLLVRENKIGYCEWPEKWDKTTLLDMGKRARNLAEREYSKKAILDKFLKAI